ncbi:unnamed protein product [Heligmosomoides polygyrus]|uniref:Uncharacterized protein n=1 Tax=Heligmosomoides polygyrus TaxID=6339 RepID=A0A183GFS7_HELPZ|nr:unnamed protein product [Heligmosomoides polygyrus]
MTRKQTAKQGRKTLDKDIMKFIESHREEAEKRYEALLRKADAVYFKLRDDIRKEAAMLLSNDILEANLFEFVFGDATANEEASENIAERATSPENVIDITSGAIAAFENLSIPVERAPDTKENEQPETSSVRTNCFVPLILFLMPGFSARTPLDETVGVSKLPSVIRPKLADVKGRHFRAARGNELAFSIDGSPIVVQPQGEVDQSAQIVKKVGVECSVGVKLNEDGGSLIP